MVSTLSRRRLLVLAGASGVAALTACTPGARDVRRPDAPCVPRAELELRRLLGDLPLVYEPSEQRQTFWFDPGFAAQLDAWVTELDPVVGSAPTQLRTYGSWLDGRQTCDSWHHAGRAFDLAQVRIEGGPAVSCRYDRWRTETGTALLESRRVQVHAVQAICSYLWDEPVELTGRWDRATRSATRRVLDRIGAADDLDASAESWHAFLRASSSVA